MNVTKDTLKKIFSLAKLSLDPKKEEKMVEDMQEILKFISVLGEVNTENVEETSQITGLTNILRDDEVELCEKEAQLLNCTPHKVENKSISVPPILS